MLSADDDPELDALRRRIDDLDRRIVGLLNERASVVIDIGRRKHVLGGPTYAPDRESQVLTRIREANRGPLSDRVLECVFREIMSGSFALERPIRIGFMGPFGSLGHVAAARHFGSSVSLEDVREVEGALREVERGHIDYAVLPVDANDAAETGALVEALCRTHERLHVYAEIAQEVRYDLLANCEPRMVQTIHGTAEALRATKRWLVEQYPNVVTRIAHSIEDAVRTVASDPTARAAAVGTGLAGRAFAVRPLFESIEDEPGRFMRYWVVARERAKPSSRDKTAIAVATQDVPSTLATMLEVLAAADLKLAHMLQCPTRFGASRCNFLLELEGNVDEVALQAALSEVRSLGATVFVLGSFPRALRVL